MGNQKFDRSKKGGSTPDKGDYLRAGKDPEVMENVAEAEKKGGFRIRSRSLQRSVYAGIRRTFLKKITETMPELPEVEIIRRYCRDRVLHKKIEKILIQSRSLLKVSEGTFRRHIYRKTFQASKRHGKYLFLRSDDGYHLVLHFGMTGRIDYGRLSDKTPEHAIFTLILSEGHKFSYTSVRKFGFVTVVPDKQDFIESKGLGPDISDLDEKEFRKIFSGSRSMIKTAMMDQAKMAGLGNVYTDEILYQAGYHPETPMEDIDDDGLKKIFGKTKRVINRSIKAKASPERMPEGFLINRREEGAACGICTGKIKKIEVGGRSTYFCASHQEMV